MIYGRVDKTTCSLVWGGGEGLDPLVLEKAADELEKCDLCVVVSWRADKTTCSLVRGGLDTLVLEKLQMS